MTLAALTAMSLIAGCANTQSNAAICDGVDMAVREHAAALVASDDDASKRSGLALLDKIEAGCK